jgi:NTE family protein
MKKFGLALGSGGGRGMFHLGVLKCLQDNGIKPDVVVGSSIGSFIGALWAATEDVEVMYERLQNDKILAAKALLDPAFLLGGLIKGESMKKVLQEVIGVGDFQSLNTRFAAVACDLKTGESVALTSGDIADSVRASMSIPGTFTPVEIGDMILADGGISNPVPDNIAREMGADVVLSVNLDFRINKVMAKNDLKRIDKVVYRMLNIMRHYLAEYSLEDSDIILNPAIEDDGMISLDYIFKEDKKKELIEMGYEMMEDKIDGLKKLLEG